MVSVYKYKLAKIVVLLLYFVMFMSMVVPLTAHAATNVIQKCNDPGWKCENSLTCFTTCNNPSPTKVVNASYYEQNKEHFWGPDINGYYWVNDSAKNILYDNAVESSNAAQVKDRESVWSFSNLPYTLLEKLLTTLAWIPMVISASLLTIIGLGFDAIIEFTIIDFTTLFQQVELGINEVWKSFRDIANIVMIAMFVFVAFAVILNVAAFGIKQFGVKILVVALLINFSLFFTKVIIDASNIVAFQFTKAIGIEVSSGGTVARLNDASGTLGSVSDKVVNSQIGSAIDEVHEIEQEGVAGAIMQRVGISNAIDSRSLMKVYEEKGTASMFFYSLMTSVFMIAIAAVLFFGLALLLVRIVMFFFLMITSALAFAAFMTPKLDGWWDKWWAALIKYALFGPLFMLFIWATLRVTSGLTGGNFADLIISPSGEAWKGIMTLVIVLGLLYASTKVANELSIIGSTWATNAAKKTGSLGLRAIGIGAGLTGGVVLRNMLARRAATMPLPASWRASLDAMSKNRNIASTKLGKGAKSIGLNFGEDKSKKVAKFLAQESERKGKKGAQAQQQQRMQDLDSRKAAASQSREQAETTKENLEGRAKQTKDTAVQQAVQKERNINAQIQNQEISKRRQENVLRGIERQLANPALSAADRDNLQTQAQDTQNQIQGMDTRIDRLKRDIQDAQRERETAEVSYSTRMDQIDKRYRSRIDSAAKLEEEINAQRKEVASDKYLKEKTSEIAKQRIDNMRLRTRSMKEMAKANIGKSKSDWSQETLNSAIERLNKKNFNSSDS